MCTGSRMLTFCLIFVTALWPAADEHRSLQFLVLRWEHQPGLLCSPANSVYSENCWWMARQALSNSVRSCDIASLGSIFLSVKTVRSWRASVFAMQAPASAMRSAPAPWRTAPSSCGEFSSKTPCSKCCFASVRFSRRSQKNLASAHELLLETAASWFYLVPLQTLGHIDYGSPLTPNGLPRSDFWWTTATTPWTTQGENAFHPYTPCNSKHYLLLSQFAALT